mmetsp:Transcript_32262/g.67651  ORF Transcript_32262/g.67651 Transcript_32262/m.67651 type:complete len:104 (+) Transcript_32262:2031-2342(+)
MQNNCILTALNLNNPSLKVRERIGNYGHARLHGAEFTQEHREEMDPKVYASRLAATRRMINQKKEHTPWALYDFLEPGVLPSGIFIYDVIDTSTCVKYALRLV